MGSTLVDHAKLRPSTSAVFKHDEMWKEEGHIGSDLRGQIDRNLRYRLAKCNVERDDVVLSSLYIEKKSLLQHQASLSPMSSVGRAADSYYTSV
jgi:hypothetical protein